MQRKMDREPTKVAMVSRTRGGRIRSGVDSSGCGEEEVQVEVEVDVLASSKF